MHRFKKKRENRAQRLGRGPNPNKVYLANREVSDLGAPLRQETQAKSDAVSDGLRQFENQESFEGGYAREYAEKQQEQDALADREIWREAKKRTDGERFTGKRGVFGGKRKGRAEDTEVEGGETSDVLRYERRTSLAASDDYPEVGDGGRAEEGAVPELQKSQYEYRLDPEKPKLQAVAPPPPPRPPDDGNFREKLGDLYEKVFKNSNLDNDGGYFDGVTHDNSSTEEYLKTYGEDFRGNDDR